MKELTKPNLQIIRYPPRYPKSVHLYITNECNLDCKNCYYRSSSDPKKELSYNRIKLLFTEWKKLKLTSIAIGGGEPLLHPDIEKIIHLGKDLGFFIAVTTNGILKKPIIPHRIHISYDELHPTWKNEKLIQDAINYYHNLGCIVGINHIVTCLENIEYIEHTFVNFTNLLLIRQKPESSFTQWDLIPYRKNYWIEGCMENSVCEQGILSFHVNYDMNASICSNLNKKIPYTNLRELWPQLRRIKCEIRDSHFT